MWIVEVNPCLHDASLIFRLPLASGWPPILCGGVQASRIRVARGEFETGPRSAMCWKMQGQPKANDWKSQYVGDLAYIAVGFNCEQYPVRYQLRDTNNRAISTEQNSSLYLSKGIPRARINRDISYRMRRVVREAFAACHHPHCANLFVFFCFKFLA